MVTPIFPLLSGAAIPGSWTSTLVCRPQDPFLGSSYFSLLTCSFLSLSSPSLCSLSSPLSLLSSPFLQGQGFDNSPRESSCFLIPLLLYNRHLLAVGKMFTSDGMTSRRWDHWPGAPCKLISKAWDIFPSNRQSITLQCVKRSLAIALAVVSRQLGGAIAWTQVKNPPYRKLLSCQFPGGPPRPAARGISPRLLWSWVRPRRGWFATALKGRSLDSSELWDPEELLFFFRMNFCALRKILLRTRHERSKTDPGLYRNFPAPGFSFSLGLGRLLLELPADHSGSSNCLCGSWQLSPITPSPFPLVPFLSLIRFQSVLRSFVFLELPLLWPRTGHGSWAPSYLAYHFPNPPAPAVTFPKQSCLYSNHGRVKVVTLCNILLFPCSHTLCPSPWIASTSAATDPGGWVLLLTPQPQGHSSCAPPPFKYTEQTMAVRLTENSDTLQQKAQAWIESDTNLSLSLPDLVQALSIPREVRPEHWKVNWWTFNDP